MNQSPISMTPGTQRGVSAIDLLIAATIIATIVALAIPLMISTQKPLVRMNAAQEFSNFWQRARSDSKKMHAVAPAQMAQITILSDQYYFVTMDADGDGVLDPPVVINLEKRKIRMSGPFPQTYMFDWLGRAFDQNQKLLSAPAVQFSNDAGKTTVKFEGTGQPAITTSK